MAKSIIFLFFLRYFVYSARQLNPMKFYWIGNVTYWVLRFLLCPFTFRLRSGFTIFFPQFDFLFVTLKHVGLDFMLSIKFETINTLAQHQQVDSLQLANRQHKIRTNMLVRYKEKVKLWKENGKANNVKEKRKPAMNSIKFPFQMNFVGLSWRALYLSSCFNFSFLFFNLF